MKKRFLVLAIAPIAALAFGFKPVSSGNESATGDYLRSNGSRMIINAIKHKDGHTSGSVYFQGATGAIILVDVDDVVFIGNSAYIHGIVTFSSNNPFLVGNNSYHRVVDNGEGAGDEPDRASAFNNPFLPLPDPISALASTSAILDGNIQVRTNQ